MVELEVPPEDQISCEAGDVLGWRHLVYLGSGWTLTLGWLGLHTFGRLRHLRPTGRTAEIVAAPISGFSSGYLASCSTGTPTQGASPLVAASCRLLAALGSC